MSAWLADTSALIRFSNSSPTVGQHRAPSIPDLIIAATAEIAGLTVLHIDKDFDLIAA